MNNANLLKSQSFDNSDVDETALVKDLISTESSNYLEIESNLQCYLELDETKDVTDMINSTTNDFLVTKDFDNFDELKILDELTNIEFKPPKSLINPIISKYEQIKKDLPVTIDQIENKKLFETEENGVNEIVLARFEKLSDDLNESYEVIHRILEAGDLGRLCDRVISLLDSEFEEITQTSLNYRYRFRTVQKLLTV